MVAIAGALVMIDGQPCAPEAARVSVFDRGFLYGDSVFETLRTYGGQPFALDEHIARLERSAALVGIRVPLSASELDAEVRRAVALAGFPESYLRVMVTRGQGQRLGLDPALAGAPLRVVIVSLLEPLPAVKYERGIAAITYRTQRVADGTEAAGAKLGNYLVAVLASEAARAADAEEALLLDREGGVLEGATSNVFAVRAGRLITPPVELGILPGITRAHVLGLAAALSLPVEERALSVGELGELDELFISSSIRELLPVVRVDGRAIGAGQPGPICARLLAAFREQAGAAR
ncbi:MAG TPA: aminotransferase class IV [Polyangiaceae bacterium]|nr:aminotransferase class IV [Polyangiaceae bacterium]